MVQDKQTFDELIGRSTEFRPEYAKETAVLREGDCVYVRKDTKVQLQFLPPKGK